MKVLKWLDDHLEESLLVILLSITSIIILLQVIMRFVFHNSLTWSEELARYLFIWMIYIGTSYGIKKKMHLRVDALNALFGNKGRLVTDMIADLFLLVFVLVLTYFGFDIVLRATRVSAALSIPMRYIYLAPVVGFGLSIVRLIQNIIANHMRLHHTGKFGKED